MKHPSYETARHKSFVSLLLAEPGAVRLLPVPGITLTRWHEKWQTRNQSLRLREQWEKVTSFFPKGKTEQWNRFWSSACFLNCNKKPSPKTYLWVAFKDVLTTFHILFSLSFLYFFAYQEVEQLLLLFQSPQFTAAASCVDAGTGRSLVHNEICGETPLVPSRVPWFLRFS